MEAFTENKINFKQERSFGELINATFAFFRQEFKSLIKPLLYFIAPVILGISLLLDFITYAGRGSFAEEPFLFVSALLSWSNILKILFTVIASYFVMFTILAYIKEYIDTGSMNDTQRIRKILLKNTLPSIGWILLSSFLTFLGLLFLFIPGIYLLVGFVMVLPVIFFEGTKDKNPTFRSFELVKGNWWLTFGLGATYMLVTYMISGFLAIPMYIIMFVSMASSSNPDFTPSAFIIIYSNVTSTLVLLIQAFGTILLSFHYYNLVEKKEMPSLMDRIENIE